MHGEQEALFTWAQQYSFEVANAMPLGNLRFGICNRLWHQWNIRIGTTAIELRYADLDRDVFQVSNESTIIELLEEYRHEWCNQQFFFDKRPPASGLISAFFVTTLLPQSASRGDFTIECIASHFSSTVKHPTTRNDPRNGLGLSQEPQFIYLFIYFYLFIIFFNVLGPCRAVPENFILRRVLHDIPPRYHRPSAAIHFLVTWGQHVQYKTRRNHGEPLLAAGTYSCHFSIQPTNPTRNYCVSITYYTTTPPFGRSYTSSIPAPCPPTDNTDIFITSEDHSPQEFFTQRIVHQVFFKIYNYLQLQ